MSTSNFGSELAAPLAHSGLCRPTHRLTAEMWVRAGSVCTCHSVLAFGRAVLRGEGPPTTGRRPR